MWCLRVKCHRHPCLCLRREAGIRRITTDRYGRTGAELSVDSSNVQQQLVAAGHAEIDGKYTHQCPWRK
ncbi:thermonuclease family protein [Synechococcus sp. CC9311]|uniref:thermonuclease family protein n=1 Tax=Synechococcus sp. (strain CC9311) TaxID=64471 RepID=UPI0011D0FA04